MDDLRGGGEARDPWRPRRRPRTRRGHQLSRARIGPRQRRSSPQSTSGRARPRRAVRLPSAYDARVCSSPAARYSSARRAVNDRRYRAHAPMRRRSARDGSLPAGTGVLRARLRSFVRPPLATSASRSSLPAAFPEIILPSRMGHVVLRGRPGDGGTSQKGLGTRSGCTPNPVESSVHAVHRDRPISACAG
jgi:hypothetical protein